MLVIGLFAPRLTVSVLGYALGAPSQYVVTLPSFALVATKVCWTDEAVMDLPCARFEPGAAVAVGVGVDVWVGVGGLVAVDVGVQLVHTVGVGVGVADGPYTGVG